jgi:DNA-directed RNA polymerase subunit RPC12/RpoP
MTIETEKEQNLICPECTSVNLRREGSTTRWKARQRVRVQRYRCLDCGLLTTRPGGFTQDHLLKCLRCGHEWSSDNIHPTRCAKCKSPYWDKPRQDVNIVEGGKE